MSTRFSSTFANECAVKARALSHWKHKHRKKIKYTHLHTSSSDIVKCSSEASCMWSLSLSFRENPAGEEARQKRANVLRWVFLPWRRSAIFSHFYELSPLRSCSLAVRMLTLEGVEKSCKKRWKKPSRFLSSKLYRYNGPGISENFCAESSHVRIPKRSPWKKNLLVSPSFEKFKKIST